MKKCLGVIVLLFVSFNFVYAKDIIKPFGNLEWDESIINTIIKVNQIEGLEKHELKVESSSVSVSILNISDQKQIINKIDELCEKVSQTPFVKEMMEKKYITPAKVEKIMLKSKLILNASPIIIENVPFNLVITFEPSEGLELKKKDAVITGKNLVYSLVLTNVKLESHSPALKENMAGIGKTLVEKYKKFDKSSIILLNRYNKEGDFEGHFQVNDDKGTRLTADKNLANQNEYYCIIYDSDYYLKELKNLYTVHLGRIEVTKNKNKKDMKSGL